MRPFTVPPNWNHHPQRASQSKFAALRRHEDIGDGGIDLKVASSQDSRRSENEDNTESDKKIKQPSLEYRPPLLLPKYNENYTFEIVNATAPSPTLANIIINVPDSPKQIHQNEIDFTNHRTDSRFDVNEVTKNLVTKDTTIQERILNRPTTPISAIDLNNQAIETNSISETETNNLIPVVTSNNVPLPATGLLPPFDSFNSYDDSTTQGPPIYFEWKIPASGLEPPKLEEIKSKVSNTDDNQIPVLPPSEEAKPLINIPIIEKELVPPIYDTNRLTLTKIRVPAIGLEPPKLVPPIVANDTVQNHTFPSLAPLNGAINNYSSASDKSQTPRSVSTSQTASPNVVASTQSIPGTTKENNYLDLQKEFLIPSFTFPLETDQRPGYERDDAVNSFQIKIPDSVGSGSTQKNWYGENAECPECHPSFLKPGTCEPCIKLR